MKRLEKKKIKPLIVVLLLYTLVLPKHAWYSQSFLSKVMYHLVFGHVISYTSPNYFFACSFFFATIVFYVY